MTRKPPKMGQSAAKRARITQKQSRKRGAASVVNKGSGEERARILALRQMRPPTRILPATCVNGRAVGVLRFK
ncbi:hypothetical protein NDU88_008195 [Pleurodeles waltl]|uniref:Uncharacterized protein n=1 Tax=Pleurodeles waltl TaxID=8319 RepID=A0AAV7QMT9_PLEWA|nr:hypothetical protein NDU88_008195 [Pleurodeles waltl]